MKRFLGLLLLASTAVYAQPEKKKKDIIYYEDSDVKDSRFSIALNLNPNFVNRRLINDETPEEGGLILKNTDAKGAFALNYDFDIFYRIGSSLDIGLGFGYSNGSYSYDGAKFYLNRPDTVTANVETDIAMYTLPIKLNFNTTMSDVFDLEVIPTVQLNFMQKYESNFSPLNGMPSFKADLSEEQKSLTFTVGIALGGTFHLNDNLGLITRLNINYMLSPLIEQDEFPRETLIDFGLNLGLKYTF